MAVAHAPFTFDGENTTYGFQPLWMVVLSVLSRFAGDKETFLRAALSSNALLHVLSGGLLWLWLRRGGHPWRGAVAAVLWWCNPSLFHLFGSGMESSLYAFLLLSILSWPVRGRSEVWGIPRRTGSLLALGALCGLLILCRVNTLLFVAALSLRMALHRGPRAGERARRLALLWAAAGLVVAPWIVFSTVQLGAVFPTSGERKLMGVTSRLSRGAAQTLPLIPRAWFRAPLSPAQKVAFDSSTEVPPTPANLVRHGLLDALDWSLAFWLPSRSWVDTGLSVRCILLLPLLAVYLALVGYGLARRRRRGKQVLYGGAAGIGILGLWALANATLNGLLLSPYVPVQYWLRVPESLFLVAAVAHGVPLAIEGVRGRRGFAAAIAGYTILSAGISGGVFASILAPRQWRDEPTYNQAAWEALEWMNAHLPPRTRVGSWNAGMLGYFSERAVVVNLDGLANSVDFLDEVVRIDAVPSDDPRRDSAILRYAEQQGIAWFADAVEGAELGREPFYQLIPSNRYEVVFRGTRDVIWDRRRATHVMAVVRLRE